MSEPDNQDSADESLNTEENTVDESADTPTGELVDENTEASSETTEGDSLESKLEKALEEAAKYKDVALRAEAEMQNLRRRSSKDLENAHKFGIEKFVKSILPVADGLDKAVESVEKNANDDATKAIADGIGICQKMMVDALNKEGIEVIDPTGEPFDPNLHQAMSMIDNPDVEPNSVVAVVQKGFTLKGRLVRPAMVMVSKPAPSDTPKIDAKA